MEIETGSVNIFARSVPKLDADIGFVGAFIAAESYVAVDPHQRAADFLGHRGKEGSEFVERLFQFTNQLQAGLTHHSLVVLLVRLKPIAMIVARKTLKKRECLCGIDDGKARHSERLVGSAHRVRIIATEIEFGIHQPTIGS